MTYEVQMKKEQNPVGGESVSEVKKVEKKTIKNFHSK
jgi:hypothetical protein